MVTGPQSRSAVVLVCSTRAAAGIYPDGTGPVILEWLTGRGWNARLTVVPDGALIAKNLGAAIDAGHHLVITSGGTGLTPNDVTPEQTAPFLQRRIPGIMEELRRRGAATTPTALLSRGLAGVAGNTVVINLPGSSGGVRDGLQVLDGLLDHLIDQIDGGDHERH